MKNIDEKFDLKSMAHDLNMSISSFHSNFKSVTGTSPLQYVKRIKLHKARSLMIQDRISAKMAAIKVGYESSSQFNREFKIFFGRTPASEVKHIASQSVITME